MTYISERTLISSASEIKTVDYDKDTEIYRRS
mgnify:CR=1 FL=1